MTAKLSIFQETELRLTQTTLDGQEIHNKEHLLTGLFQVHGNKAVTKNNLRNQIKGSLNQLIGHQRVKRMRLSQIHLEDCRGRSWGSNP